MFTLNCNGKLLLLNKPVLMGIINITPDSFYPGSRQQDMTGFLQQAEKMIREGATILDIGGQSTRPGSERIDADTELQRVMAPIEALHKRFPDTFLSIDTYHARVAKEAVAAGVSIINDISAGTMDAEMIATVAALQVPYVLMHIKGTPETMLEQAHYENVTRDVLDFFIKKLAVLHDAGIHDIIIDPGFGFGKTITHNFELLRHLEAFRILKAPILLGLSRKSTIYKTLGVAVAEALNGTTVLNTIGLINGAHILRVHDVKEAGEVIKLVESYNGKSFEF
jgi:dihydropteroate synthase